MLIRDIVGAEWYLLVALVLGYGFLIPLGIAAGSYLAGKFGGGGGGKADDEQRAEIDPYQKLLEQSSLNLRKQGGDLQGMGMDTLQPATQYLRQLLSADPSQVLAATAPERARVIDQYDTARQAIAEFSPRGGGTTSALAGSRIAEAGDLADITNTGRREAFGQAMSLGTNLTGLGLSAEQLASADLNTIIENILTQQGFDVQRRAQNMQMYAALGQAAGYAAGSYLGRD